MIYLNNVANSSALELPGNSFDIIVQNISNASFNACNLSFPHYPIKF